MTWSPNGIPTAASLDPPRHKDFHTARSHPRYGILSTMKALAARQTLANEVASVIREEILSGRLRPGERLVEVTLASTLGVSRAPVREAIKLLRAEGLVTEEPNRGACVISLDLDDVREIYDLRAGLEARAARLVARRRRPKDAAALRRILAELETAASAGDVMSYASADIVFHITLVELAENSRLLESFNRSVPVLRALIPLDESSHMSLETMPQEHLHIVEAIERGQEDDAARYAERHVDVGREHVLSQWKRVTDGPGGDETPPKNENPRS